MRQGRNSINLNLWNSGMAAIFALFVLLMTGGGAQGQSYAELDRKGVDAMRAYLNGDTAGALRIVNGVISDFGGGALSKYGLHFGKYYYLKGLFHLRLKQTASALNAFQTCRDSFANLPGSKGRPNMHFTSALIQIGGIRFIEGDYDRAANAYRLAIGEGIGLESKQLYVKVNLARAKLRGGDDSGRRELLQMMGKSSDLDPRFKRRLFLYVCSDWTATIPFPYMVEFLKDYDHHIMNSSRPEREEASDTFRKLAAKATVAGEPMRALVWYRYVYNPEDDLGRLRRRIKDIRASEEKPGERAADITLVEKEISKKKLEAANIRFELAGIHSTVRNFRAARPLYREFVDTQRAHTKRPTALHNLVAADIFLEQWDDTYTDAHQFFAEHGNDPLRPKVAKMLSEALYMRSQFADCMKVAAEQRKTLDVGSAGREPLDFLVGACRFHLGYFKEADVEWAEYLKAHEGKGNPKRLEAARYYQGITKVALRKWVDALDLLEAFIEKHKRSQLVGGAYYHAALCHLVLDQFHEGLNKIRAIETDHRDAPEIAAAYNLKGDLMASLGDAKPIDIQSCYRRALELSEGKESDNETAAYALWQLVAYATLEEQFEDATRFYDRFQSEHARSRFKVDATVAALKALGESERREEGLAKLEGYMREYSSDISSPELVELFGSYAGFLKDYYPIGERLAPVRRFRREQGLPVPLFTWLLVTEIDVLEEMKIPDNAPAELLPAMKEERASEIRRLHFQLHLDHELADISNYGLTKLARWLVDKQKKEAEARKIYEFMIANRARTQGIEYAYFDSAMLDAESNGASALTRFQTVLDDFDTPELIEPATLEIARIHMRAGRFKEAKSWWETYLNDRKWRQARGEANFELARCIDELGAPEEAMKRYVGVYVNFPGQLEWSMRAYLRTAQILKGMGKDQKALMVLKDMILRMRERTEHPAYKEALVKFYQWRKEYEEKLKNQK